YTVPIEMQLFTLFVPENESFLKYFSSIGKTGVADLSQQEAVQLFTLHVLRNPRSRYHLIYEYIWEEEQGPKGEYASLFFRKPTKSFSLPKVEVRKYNTTLIDQEYLVYSENKYLPIFSTNFFSDYFGSSDGSDYLFMYRDSKWGDNLNIHASMVTEAEVRTANGFIYYLDKVIEPMPNIDEYLRDKKDEFTVFYDLMQRFADYTFTKVRPEDKMKLYQKSYRIISNLADETGAFGSNRAMKEMYSLFAPTDKTMTTYLNEKLLKNFESIDSIPEITLAYIVETQMAWSLCLISKIEHLFFNMQGDQTEISRNDIESAFMCSNGVVYGTNRVLEPNVFITVPGNLFFDKDYSTFLIALTQADVMSRLSNINENVTLFAVNNEQMEKHNIRFSHEKSQIQFFGSDGLWKPIKADFLREFVLDHICIGSLNDLSGEGFIEMQSKNYIHYKDNKIYGGENISQNIFPKVAQKIENEKNGMLYLLDNPIKTRFSFGQLISSDPDLEKFKDLLIMANLLDTSYVDIITDNKTPMLLIISESDYWTFFLPDNNAIDKAFTDGLLPDITQPLLSSGIDSIRSFCNYHFIRKNVIFDDGKESGELDTNQPSKVADTKNSYAKIIVNNNYNNLSITDLSGNVINIDHKNANLLVSKGVVHKISTVLKSEL
ncbi:MAG TPA: fasciclin domain-containing protein, partial [Prolixibacteraceae bacterium]|nr:fasciclin domain-containing protein [Prolixibacteraceae bacterium]